MNPYPVTVSLHDKIIAFQILNAACVPTPATYIASHAEQLAPLLDDGPLVLKPHQGGGGYGVRLVRSPAELTTIPYDRHTPLFAQRYHAPQGHDRKVYVIGDRLFGVKKVFPRRTEEEKRGEPFDLTSELCEIARRCGQAFGIDLYGVDIIESGGKPYVVDMDGIPGYKGVPGAPQLLAGYLQRAAKRAADGERTLQPSFSPHHGAPVPAFRALGAGG